MENGEPPKNEDSRDAMLLAALGDARAREDIEAEKRAMAELISGWLGKAERWLAFKGVGPEHCEEIIGLWWFRLVKALKENHEFPYRFGTIAMKRIEWAYAEHFRQSYHERELSSEVPVSEHGNEGRREDDRTLDHLVLEKALQRLPDKDREVIEASFLADLSAAEAGERLDLKEGAMRTAKTRALKRLRSEFSQMEVTNLD